MKKIIAIGIIGMFLLTGLTAMSAMGTKASLPEQPLHNKNNVADEYEGDLTVLEPQLLPWWPFGGYHRLTVKIKNIGVNPSPAPFYDSIIWDLGLDGEQVLHPEHLHQVDIGSVEVDVHYIYFLAPSKGEHTITICTDSHQDPELDNLVFEEDETNNDWAIERNFQWIETRSCQIYSQFLRWSYLFPNAFPILQTLLQRFGLQ